MPFGDPDRVTPRYRTAVVLDKFGPSVVQPFFAFQRTAPEMARGNTGPQSNLAYFPAVGIILKPHQLEPSRVYEADDAQGGYLTGAAVTVPSRTILMHTSRTYAYTGVGYSGAAAQGQPMFQKRIGEGEDWTERNTADQLAFPEPNPGEDICTMDRVLTTTFDHDPRDFLTFQLHVPGAKHDRPGACGSFYFCGPAGKTGTETGLGQYALKCFADGLAKLYERCRIGDGDPFWLLRYEFIFSPVAAAGMAFFITVGSDCAMGEGGQFFGSKLVFRTLMANEARQGSGIGESVIGAFTAVAALAISRQIPVTVFTVPQKARLPVQQTMVRIDCRRDVRAMFGVSKHTYPTTGKIVDDPFSFPFHPSPDKKFQIELYCIRPTDTTITLKLFRDDTGEEVPGTVTIDDNLGLVVEFDPPIVDEDHPLIPRTYHVEIEKTGPGSSTPVTLEYRVFRDAVVETPDFPTTTVTDLRDPGPTLPVLFPQKIEVNPASEDPESEHMVITLQDLGGVDPNLQFKTGTPIDVRLMDRENGDLVTIVQGGIIGQSVTTPYNIEGHEYPHPDAYQLVLNCPGEVARLRRKLLPFRFVAQDTSSGSFAQPLKATDAVYLLMNEGMGVPDEELDIPDLPQRLFEEAGGENLQSVEPGNPAFDVVKEIVSDYTGGYLIRDKNAFNDPGSYDPEDPDVRGMWRMLLKHRPPYNNLLKIHRFHPGPGKLPTDLRNYPDETGEGGQVIKGTFGIHGTETITREPPEGNLVQVFGGSGGGSSVGLMHSGMLTQVAFNPVSFNYLNLPSDHVFYPNPDSPDFLGEAVQIQVYDPTLTTQEAVDWVTRRVFDSACFGRDVRKVTIALQLVTDVNDTKQVRPRMPRFNDPVLYQHPDGAFYQYLVASVSMPWEYDGLILCQIEIVTTTNIEVFGLPLGAFDIFDLTRARIRSVKSAVGVPARSRKTRWRQREFKAITGFSGWPTTIPTEIQYTDPELETFGQFKYMVDYDPVA